MKGAADTPTCPVACALTARYRLPLDSLTGIPVDLRLTSVVSWPDVAKCSLKWVIKKTGIVIGVGRPRAVEARVAVVATADASFVGNVCRF